jgi:hypothetical protein
LALGLRPENIDIYSDSDWTNDLQLKKRNKHTYAMAHFPDEPGICDDGHYLAIRTEKELDEKRNQMADHI